jgi:hypothetical protein
VIDLWITLLAGVIDIARIIGRVYSSTLNRGVLGFARQRDLRLLGVPGEKRKRKEVKDREKWYVGESGNVRPSGHLNGSQQKIYSLSVNLSPGE